MPDRAAEETARLIDEEVKQILSKAHSRASDLLNSRRAAMEVLAKLLLEKEAAGRPALQVILKVRSIDSAKDKNEKNPQTQWIVRVMRGASNATPNPALTTVDP
jgi:peptidase M41-like protein